MKKLFMTALCFCSALNMLLAQNGRKEVVELMQKLILAYRSAPYLSFDVRYTYAAENEPSIYRDSLSGRVKLNGDNYWYDLNNTEAVCTNEYQIMLFKEDNVMYLAKPSAKAKPALSNPVGLLDSVFLSNKDIRFDVRDERSNSIVVLSFTDHPVYRRIEYYIDKKSGLLQKTVNVVRAEELYEAADRALLAGAVTYAIVEAVYSNYSTAGFDAHLFDSNRYFVKQGAEYTTVTPFESYKIFLGTPNL